MEKRVAANTKNQQCNGRLIWNGSKRLFSKETVFCVSEPNGPLSLGDMFFFFPGGFEWIYMDKYRYTPIYIQLQNALTQRDINTRLHTGTVAGHKYGNAGAPITTTKTTRPTRGIRKMPWPARSPDLNPIENVWAILKRRTKNRFRKLRPHNQREVVEVAQEEWEKLPWKHIYDMIDGMPRRVEAVINAEGERTKY